MAKRSNPRTNDTTCCTFDQLNVITRVSIRPGIWRIPITVLDPGEFWH